MSKTKMLHWFYKLSWKKMGGLAVLVMGLGLLPTIQEAALNPTRTRSDAALINKVEPISKEFVIPNGPPEVYLVDHFFGKVGDAVLVHGNNLGGFHQNSSVSLAGKTIGVEDLVTWTNDYIEFKVPEGAVSGQVAVSVLGRQAEWPGMFFVVDHETETELQLKGEGNTATLLANDLDGARSLLLWILVVSGEGNLVLAEQPGVNLTEQIIDLPIGRIYQARVTIDTALANRSINNQVGLLKITKNDNQVIGIARAEVDLGNGVVKPVKSSPLYVSF